jgi:hypothetical protein
VVGYAGKVHLPAAELDDEQHIGRSCRR